MAVSGVNSDLEGVDLPSFDKRQQLVSEDRVCFVSVKRMRNRERHNNYTV